MISIKRYIRGILRWIFLSTNFSEKAVKRISVWYQTNKDLSDIIVTASPEFLVEAIIGRMIKVKVIGTLMRKEDGNAVKACISRET